MKVFTIKFKYINRLDDFSSEDTISDTESLTLKRISSIFKPMGEQVNKKYNRDDRIVIIKDILLDEINKAVLLKVDYTRKLNSPILLHKTHNIKDGLVEDGDVEEEEIKGDGNAYMGNKDYCICFVVKGISKDEITNEVDVDIETYVMVKGNYNPLLIIIRMLEDSLKNKEVELVLSPKMSPYGELSKELQQLKLKATICINHDVKYPNDKYEITASFRPMKDKHFGLNGVKRLLGQFIEKVEIQKDTIQYFKGIDKGKQSLDIIEDSDGSFKSALVYKKRLTILDNRVSEFFIKAIEEESKKQFNFISMLLKNG